MAQEDITAMVARILFHIKEGARSIVTHGLMSFASVCMIVACLLIMGSFSLIAVNASHMLGDQEEENEFLAYVNENYTHEQALALQSTIESIPNVTEVTFETRESAMEKFQEEQNNPMLFGELGGEVFRDRFHIHVADLEQMKDTSNQVQGINGIDKIRVAVEIAEGFVMIRNVATAIAIILIAMLVIISLFIISNTIKLATFTRRDEIAIIKMCGATDWFIRWPFIIEGIILGLLGGLVAYFAEWGIYSAIHKAVEESGMLSFINVIPYTSMAHTVMFVFLLVGFVIGAGGSVLAIRKFLKV